jgi:dihydropteroate synthase
MDPQEHPTLKLKVRQLFGSLPSVELRQVVPIRRKNKEGQLSERVIYADQLSSTHVLGILNVTPDSFSDGGKLSTVELAVAHATTLIQNAGEQNVGLILDVGGESTRPGSEPVSEEEELNRVLPVIESLQAQQPNVTISIDTTKPNVARAAIRNGVSIINDVSAGNSDIDITPMANVAVEERVPFIIMHSRGTPQTMKQLSVYPDDVPVIRVVAQELNKNIETALALGVYPWQIITDPGIGFAKQLKHNLDILKDLPQWSALVGHFPLVVGTSRKAFIGAVTHQPEGMQPIDFFFFLLFP